MAKRTNWSRANAVARRIFTPRHPLPFTASGVHAFIEQGWFKGYAAARREMARTSKTRRTKGGAK